MTLSELFAKLKPTPKSSRGSAAIRVTPQLTAIMVGVAIVLADVWIIQSAAKVLYQYRFTDPGARTVQSTRVNFESYNKAIQRIEGAKKYTPTKPAAPSPFVEVSRLAED